MLPSFSKPISVACGARRYLSELVRQQQRAHRRRVVEVPQGRRLWPARGGGAEDRDPHGEVCEHVQVVRGHHPRAAQRSGRPRWRGSVVSGCANSHEHGGSASVRGEGRVRVPALAFIT